MDSRGHMGHMVRGAYIPTACVRTTDSHLSTPTCVVLYEPGDRPVPLGERNGDRGLRSVDG